MSAHKKEHIKYALELLQRAIAAAGCLSSSGQLQAAHRHPLRQAVLTSPHHLPGPCEFRWECASTCCCMARRDVHKHGTEYGASAQQAERKPKTPSPAHHRSQATHDCDMVPQKDAGNPLKGAAGNKPGKHATMAREGNFVPPSSHCNLTSTHFPFVPFLLTKSKRPEIDSGLEEHK